MEGGASEAQPGINTCIRALFECLEQLARARLIDLPARYKLPPDSLVALRFGCCKPLCPRVVVDSRRVTVSWVRSAARQVPGAHSQTRVGGGTSRLCGDRFRTLLLTTPRR